MVVDFNFLSAFLFFFSSRRRHTRSLRDWSSDVCSSDLREQLTEAVAHLRRAVEIDPRQYDVRFELIAAYRALGDRAQASNRSEERRVGKECRARWSARD